jgi:RNA polymerase sigma-70 factor, ECF subfamily
LWDQGAAPGIVGAAWDNCRTPMLSNGNDRSLLIAKARRAEPGALGRLLEAYRNYLRLLARTGIDRALQGKADPSDLVQEALLRASRRFDQFRGGTEAELAGWLRQILARCLADLARGVRHGPERRPAREQSLDQLLNQSSQALGQVLAADATSPSAAAERRDLGVVLSDALADLPPDYRDVLVLRYLEGLGWEQVAGRMGRSVGAVRKLWTRALRQLRPLIEEKLNP